ncbi:hypothetical protein MKK75_28950, partial [Methylobacterium sp. J-030]|uniref:hypothetical protein n=1 Tax=Methylobacterium sp. J-030 TaxID=2836627 RepID=UPI001FB956D1
KPVPGTIDKIVCSPAADEADPIGEICQGICQVAADVSGAAGASWARAGPAMAEIRVAQQIERRDITALLLRGGELGATA